MSTKFFVCNKCGNIIVKLNDSGVTPDCCGESMHELVQNTFEGVGEKHLPLVTILDEHSIRVHVGSQLHPMENDHYIHFVAVETTNGLIVHYLHPGDIPILSVSMEDTDQAIAVYEYCNLHGLWKTVMPFQEKDSCPQHRVGLFCRR